MKTVKLVFHCATILAAIILCAVSVKEMLDLWFKYFMVVHQFGWARAQLSIPLMVLVIGVGCFMTGLVMIYRSASSLNKLSKTE